jgi:hypothetical protein
MRERLYQNRKKNSLQSLKWAIGAILALALVLGLQIHLQKLARRVDSSKPGNEFRPESPSINESRAQRNLSGTTGPAVIFAREVFDEWFPPWRDIPSDRIQDELFEKFDAAIGGRPLSEHERLRLQSAFGVLLERGPENKRRREEARRLIMDVIDRLQIPRTQLQEIWQILSNSLEAWAAEPQKD